LTFGIISKEGDTYLFSFELSKILTYFWKFDTILNGLSKIGMVIEMGKSNVKVMAKNRRARHDYFIEDSIEAGIVLKGTEVKSIRQGRCNIKDSHALVENGEVFLYNMHISPYEQGNRYNEDPTRKRKLLLNKREINKLIGYTAQKGYTLVPITVYIKKGLVKVELAIAKGKKLYDKRESIAKKEVERKIQREFKERY